VCYPRCMRTLSHDLATGTNRLHNQPSPVSHIASLVYTNYSTALAIARDRGTEFINGMTGFPHTKYLSLMVIRVISEFLMFYNGCETWSFTSREELRPRDFENVGWGEYFGIRERKWYGDEEYYTTRNFIICTLHEILSRISGYLCLIITGSRLNYWVYWHFFTVTVNFNSSQSMAV
jgi:hypothetical protein